MAPTATGSTVLIVDDEPDMRFLAGAVFEGSEIVVAGEAVDGPDALRVISQLDPPPIPTVILLDNQMPGMTGLEVAARILADHPHQVIVLFSAYLDESVVAQANRIGIAACVSKNEAMRLPEIITELLNERS
ncbi:response regulator transcription factor [uncultured Jatrophihabitans sp.]|uniref:response regulator transcription factor n=1 Tax=uncultured Jatrophihabitans sp. TaxID=1610747 RepID=UPI0035CB2DAE